MKLFFADGAASRQRRVDGRHKAGHDGVAKTGKQ